ncbi:hypothetical protein O3G_MSEX014250 [Manduca sexta]|uniref:Acyltransferase 3 domain-containing protein n=1 Tax=Manduca sexta TaxID=7130 RepID=A0A921ZV83_MANSE|nr:hypothetical protein O3G_MSEX014250 [Manduca sexta]
MIMIKGTSLVHMFVMLSSFLCAYNMLLSSEKSPLSLRSFPTNVLKRIIRIAPVYLLIVGYGATWWPRTRDGPLTDLIIGSQSQICREKFWYHVFFVNNIFDAKNHCFIQTWFLAVDMQLYILASFLTLALAPLKQRVLPIYAALFFGSCVLISGISYIQDWKSMLYIANPESIKEVLYNSPSFQGLYTSPLGGLPACIMGLYIAHLHYYMHESGYKISANKVLNVIHNWMIPVYIAWLISGLYIRTVTSHAFTAAYTGIERCIFCIICATQIIGSINIDSHIRRFFAWSKWDTFARMSLPVMMVHWCVNTLIAVPRPYTTFSSGFDIAVDAVATAVMSYTIAVPISVMVELPMQKFLDCVIIKNIQSSTKQ